MEETRKSANPKCVLLAELADNIFVAKVPLDELKEQALNARTMPRDMFKQLSANIGSRGALVESLPYCAETKNGIEIVSGHHRIRGARAAHLQEAFILLDMSGLTPSQIKSKQLSHNSISGVDDSQILKELFEQIEDAGERIKAFIDPKSLEIPVPPSISIGDIGTDVQFKQVSFVFLDHQLQKFDEAIESIQKDTTMVGVCDLAQFEKFKAAVTKVRDIDDIRAVGMILSKMCDIVLAHYKPIEEKIEQDKKISGATLDEKIGEAPEGKQ